MVFSQDMGLDAFFSVYDENIMQSTGLNDKNRVELYEGDVVRISNSAIGEMMKGSRGIEPKNYIVEWSDVWYGWQFKDLGLIGYEESDWKQCEVIGNIYESPSLLPL